MVARGFSSANKSNASYSTHLFSRRAVDIIEAHAGADESPFFIYLAYQATHAPLQAPPEVVATFSHIQDPDRRTFAAMAAVVDEGVGNISSALLSSGNDNTVLFVSGDNGGTIRAGGNNYPLRGFKGSLWEGRWVDTTRSRLRNTLYFVRLFTVSKSPSRRTKVLCPRKGRPNRSIEPALFRRCEGERVRLEPTPAPAPEFRMEGTLPRLRLAADGPGARRGVLWDVWTRITLEQFCGH